jgi:alkylation response protein AidB-like acyl-CoA dehydrogenase
MEEKYISMRNLKFLLHEVFHASELKQYEPYADYDNEAFDMTLEAAKQIGDQHLFPIYREMDKNKAYYKDGTVYVHPNLREVYKAIAEGGWLNALDSYEDEGQQMPLTLFNAGVFIFYAANANAASPSQLTVGAANLIKTFGSQELKATYLPKMHSMEWQGTMALTEPQAGSSLSDITSTAYPQSDGTYKIKGQKIYISAGDHDAVDNVVHLLLARIEGAPAGTKGISLFVVPKFRPEGDDLIANDVTTAGIYGKMGQKGYVAAHLMFGEQDACTGYLVGEAHHGLPYMFQMMNEARIGTGLLSAGNISGAYYAALKYANERAQGRHPSNKDLSQDQVLIIEHADVRRMLLMQKAVLEGSISLLLQCSYLADLAIVAEGEVREEAHLLLELLTPIAKSFPAEMGTLAISNAMQCLGGAGYTDDFPIEQYYRDIRINAIYEGTTTIHGMDLLGRKVSMAGGKAFKLFVAEIQKTMDKALSKEELKPFVAQLAERLKSLHETTLHLFGLASTEKPEVFLADATLYLEFFGLVVVSWQLLKQAIVAQEALAGELPENEFNFYSGKIKILEYFLEYELVKSIGIEKRLKSSKRTCLDTPGQFIN